MSNVFDFCHPASQRTVPPVCSAEAHDKIKADPERWAALEHVGTQTYDYDDGMSERHEHRNCTCGSTLVKVKHYARRQP